MYTNCSRLLLPMFDLIYKKTAECSPKLKTFGVLVSFGVFTTSSSACTTSSSSSTTSSGPAGGGGGKTQNSLLEISPNKIL